MAKEVTVEEGWAPGTLRFRGGTLQGLWVKRTIDGRKVTHVKRWKDIPQVPADAPNGDEVSAP